MHVLGIQQAKVRTDRAKGAETLALVELHLRDLNVSCRVVIDNDHAGDELVQVGVGDGHCAADDALHHQPEFDFIIKETDAARLDQDAVCGHQATGRLGEDHVVFLCIRVHARLDHVLSVVGPLANELLIAGHRRQQFHFVRLQLSTIQLSEVRNSVLADKVARGLKGAWDNGDTVLA
ncbi:hypothetical protein D3C76_757330 [compost metagenome]